MNATESCEWHKLALVVCSFSLYIIQLFSCFFLFWELSKEMLLYAVKNSISQQRKQSAWRKEAYRGDRSREMTWPPFVSARSVSRHWLPGRESGKLKCPTRQRRGRRASETITLHVFEVIDTGVYITLIFVISKELFTDEHEAWDTVWFW